MSEENGQDQNDMADEWAAALAEQEKQAPAEVATAEATGTEVAPASGLHLEDRGVRVPRKWVRATPRIGVDELPECVRKLSHLPVGHITHVGNTPLKKALADPERQILMEALEQNGWNRQNTAAMLGINRTTLYKKMKKLGIDFEKQLQLN